MLIGYARVSTHDQNLDLQRDALTKTGCERIFADEASGASTSRPELDRALDMLREGDTLAVWRLDRLGRSLRHLIELIGALEKRGVAFRSLQESIDTMTSGGKLIFHVFGALAEFERNLIRERTQAGLASARARGRNGGRPRSLDAAGREAVVALYRSRSQPVKEICRVMKISKPTLYEYVREADARDRARENGV